MEDRQRLLAALDIIATAPAFRDEKKIWGRPDLFERAVDESLKSGAEGKAVREKLYDLMKLSVSGAVVANTVRALGKVLERTGDSAIREEIVSEFADALHAASPGVFPTVSEVLAEFAVRAPGEWYGSLSRTFARAALQDGKGDWLNNLYDKIWMKVGANRLEDVWPQRAP